MKLSKEQALDLVKILTHYQTLAPDSDVGDAMGLCSDLEEYVLHGDEDEDGDEEETDDEEDEEGEEDSGEKDAEEPDESEDEEGDEADDEGEEDDDGGDPDEEELDVDSYAYAGDLHDLKVVKAKVISSSVGDPDDEVTLEFEHTENDDANICDLLVSGEAIGPITHVRRKGTELHVAENNSGERAWHRFHVARFPKGWADTLPLDNLVEVE
jgi:hypothetical protein